jgi:hypothetical protein
MPFAYPAMWVGQVMADVPCPLVHWHGNLVAAVGVELKHWARFRHHDRVHR